MLASHQKFKAAVPFYPQLQSLTNTCRGGDHTGGANLSDAPAQVDGAGHWGADTSAPATGSYGNENDDGYTTNTNRRGRNGNSGGGDYGGGGNVSGDGCFNCGGCKFSSSLDLFNGLN